MKIYLVYTCDPWKSRNSYILRGVVTDINLVSWMKSELLKNDVVDNEDELDVITIEENTCETNGGFII